MVFSGENQHIKEYVAGVAIVMKNDMVKHLIDIEPVSDRTMWAKWNGTKQMTTVNTHIPQAMRSKVEKDKVYSEVNNIIRRNKHQGPVVIAGDFNARVQKATNAEERRRIGKWIFEPESANTHGRTEGVLENRVFFWKHATHTISQYVTHGSKKSNQKP